MHQYIYLDQLNIKIIKLDRLRWNIIRANVQNNGHFL